MEKNIPENVPPEEEAAVSSETAESEAPPPLQPASPTPSSTNPLVIGAALTVAFAVGLFLGLLGRPLIIQDVPVQVVVTVVPDSNSQAVAQTESGEPEETTETGLAVPDPNATATPTLMEFVLADARHVQGDEAAPITLVEFSDFKWSFCGRFANDSLGRIREEYVETGKVKFIYKHFAILGPESNRGAEASECAAEQEAFWPFHDLVFKDQAENYSALDQETLVGFAEQLGLDTEAFSDCLSSGRYSLQIQQESQTVSALGLRGTPGFLVNGLFINGAQPFDVFQQIIDEQLAAAVAE